MSLTLSSFLHDGFQANGSGRDARSPFDGSVIATVLEAGPLNVIQSLAPAKKALEAADALGPADRAAWLEKMAAALEEKENEFADREALFEGLPSFFVLEKSIRPVARLLRRIADELKSSATESLHRTGLIAVLTGGPLAFRTIGERLIPALAAGNAVLVKVPSSSPVTAKLWGDLLALSGAPAGLAQLFLGPGKEIGALLASHPSIHAVSFAGRPETMRTLLPSAAQTLKKAQFSGGVKNSSLCLADADFSRLPEILFGSLVGGGRLGWGLSRIFVTEARAEEFFSAARSYLESLEPLRDPGGRSPWTPISPSQLDLTNRQLEQAAQEKAKFLRRGDSPSSPVLLRDLTNCSTLQLEELHSPLLIVNTVKYAHEMAKWTNTGDYGFCASLWGGDEAARRLGAKLNVARVWVNGWLEGEGGFAGWRKSFFGNPDFRWQGSFYSDVKTLT